MATIINPFFKILWSYYCNVMVPQRKDKWIHSYIPEANHALQEFLETIKYEYGDVFFMKNSGNPTTLGIYQIVANTFMPHSKGQVCMSSLDQRNGFRQNYADFVADLENETLKRISLIEIEATLRENGYVIDSR